MDMLDAYYYLSENAVAPKITVPVIIKIKFYRHPDCYANVSKHINYAQEILGQLSDVTHAEIRVVNFYLSDDRVDVSDLMDAMPSHLNSSKPNNLIRMTLTYENNDDAYGNESKVWPVSHKRADPIPMNYIENEWFSMPSVRVLRAIPQIAAFFNLTDAALDMLEAMKNDSPFARLADILDGGEEKYGGLASYLLQKLYIDQCYSDNAAVIRMLPFVLETPDTSPLLPSKALPTDVLQKRLARNHGKRIAYLQKSLLPLFAKDFVLRIDACRLADAERLRLIFEQMGLYYRVTLSKLKTIEINIGCVNEGHGHGVIFPSQDVVALGYRSVIEFLKRNSQINLRFVQTSCQSNDNELSLETLDLSKLFTSQMHLLLASIKMIHMLLHETRVDDAGCLASLLINETNVLGKNAHGWPIYAIDGPNAHHVIWTAHAFKGRISSSQDDDSKIFYTSDYLNTTLKSFNLMICLPDSPLQPFSNTIYAYKNYMPALVKALKHWDLIPMRQLTADNGTGKAISMEILCIIFEHYLRAEMEESESLIAGDLRVCFVTVRETLIKYCVNIASAEKDPDMNSWLHRLLRCALSNSAYIRKNVFLKMPS